MNAANPIFHKGELAIQSRLGIAEKMDHFGRRMIRDHMPQQHQDFYNKLPMVFTGFSDNEGQVWASVLAGEPGFISTASDTELQINAQPFAGDPLQKVLHTHSAEMPLRLGMMGIELHSRRRNRLSAEVTHLDDGSISLDVLQTFGNCPQYIQNRSLSHANMEGYRPSTRAFTYFDAKLKAFLQNADTFFVASSTVEENQGQDSAHLGADVSHRGGKPGFISVDDSMTLTIPDYSGNNHFNTLGNFMVNPSAGLLFVDFETGDVITMTGKATVLWDDNRRLHFKGAERLWQFKLVQGYVLKGVMPYRFKLEDYSPSLAHTGTWQDAEQHVQETKSDDEWLTWSIDKTVDESPSIKSFYFRTHDDAVPTFKPGQFITLSVEIDGKDYIRTYSLSSAPEDNFVRISVKRDGLVSNWLHDNLKPYMPIRVKKPQGGFYLTSQPKKPAVLLSAGVGITPMMSMMRHIIKTSEQATDQGGEPGTNPSKAIMINTFRHAKDQAFFDEVNQMIKKDDQRSDVYWLLTSPESTAKAGVDYSGKGRISKDVLQAILPLGQYSFYLCGPADFMQQSYDILMDLGVPDDDIHAEAFGPASLKRQSTSTQHVSTQDTDVADKAVVTFAHSNVEQAWEQKEGALLPFAESHGLTPEYGCRNGSCGSCKVNVTKGQVVHADNASFPLEDNEALLCCAMPAKSDDEVTTITLAL